MAVRRVVITGMGAVSPFGRGVDVLLAGLRENRSAVVCLPELARVGGLRSRIGAPVPELPAEEIPRRFRRSMSRMSVFATMASLEALRTAGLGTAACASGRLGVAIGSTTGSTPATEEFFREYFATGSLESMKSTHFFKIMNHSCAANVAQALGVTGRLLSPSAACATSGQALGYGFEQIAGGWQDQMLCGGADELHPLTTGVFDIMNAASTRYNEHPAQAPRPFDRDRDGGVCAEGGGILLLEDLGSARQRGAPVLAEVVGFATNTDPESIANPNPGPLADCMRAALAAAGVPAGQVDYVNAHATGTEHGDRAESEAIARVLGAGVPVSSLKGHLGHTMAASGALEIIATVQMLRSGEVLPTRNLENPDPACAIVNLVRQPERRPLAVALKNNFALGGVNTTIVLRKEPND